MNKERLWSVIYKEFIHIRRDPPSLAIAFLMPIMLLFLFGYAVTTDVENINMIVWDQSQTSQSLELVESFSQSGVFTLREYTYSLQGVRNGLDSGNAKAALVIPPDYHRKLTGRKAASVQFLVDGSDPTVARTALNSGLIIVQNKGIELVGQRFNTKLQNLGAIDFQPRVWYNPEMKSVNFNIPGLIGLILQNITVMLTAFTLVRERERGTLEQLIVTPVKPTELMIGKLVPYILIAVIDVSLALIVNTFWFKVSIQGSLILLLTLSIIFLVAALGIGLFISTVASNQLQAMQATIAFLLPSVLLSGFMFPRDAMPVIIQWLGYLIPLTYFLEILRGIIVKGVGIEYLWFQTTLLAIFGIFIISLASLRFRKKLD
ncbi:MAG: drug efflux transport system permease protein [Clostridia bacterium]|jgi:ABC-2 type transport system permease protein|nr:drug efflux transport system permease protein [Clostridia bacterium]